MGEFETIWETAGRRVAASLDDVSAVVVVGDDPIATASAALGIGRVQALRRRVALGDLIGDVAPLRDLVTDDDPHGISDAFLYGVSLNKIARPVDTTGNLHVMPSGSEQVLQEEVLTNDRWRRLADGFREVGALLLLVAPAAVPGLDSLAAALDGLVLVGGCPNPVPGAAVLAEVRSPPRRSPAEGLPAIPRRAPVRRRAPATRVPWPVIAGAILAIALAGAYVSRDRLRLLLARSSARPTNADSLAAASPAPPPDDTLLAAPVPALVPVNPQDSAAATAYSVDGAWANTEAGAMLILQEIAVSFPASTFSPLARPGNPSLWYRVIAGASRRRAEADSLLGVLRNRRLLGPTDGDVARRPLALRLDTPATRSTAAAVVASLRQQGIPAYALVQDNGSVNVYAGAFETVEQSSPLATALESTTIQATLAYRVGRAF